MAHRMMVARVWRLHHDECRRVSRNEDPWESVHSCVESDLGLVLVYAWLYEGNQQAEWGHLESLV